MAIVPGMPATEASAPISRPPTGTDAEKTVV